jgi:hypothetical protein
MFVIILKVGRSGWCDTFVQEAVTVDNNGTLLFVEA